MCGLADEPVDDYVTADAAPLRNNVEITAEEVPDIRSVNIERLGPRSQGDGIFSYQPMGARDKGSVSGPFNQLSIAQLNYRRCQAFFIVVDIALQQC